MSESPVENAPTPQKPPSRIPRGYLIGGGALLFLLVVVLAARMPQWLEERAEEEAAQRARATLKDALLSARIAPTPCLGLHHLDETIATVRQSRHESVTSITQEMDGPRGELARACCEYQLAHIRTSLTELNESGPPEDETRSDTIALLGSVTEETDEQTGALSACGADGVLDQIAAVALVERANEEKTEAAWRSYARLLEADAKGVADIGDFLVPPARRVELFQQCLRVGLNAVERATQQGAHADALAMLRDLTPCVEHRPAGVEIAETDRAQLARLKAALEERAAAPSR